ncbi:MAG TPA: hypothetical protein VJR04_17060 [Terriglobales bacterium]|nr:hypothetical protein [Terriglobales bacterium]
MPRTTDNGTEAGFAREFGQQLEKFLEDRLIRPAEAAERMGTYKQKLNGYINDQKRLTKERKIVMVRVKPESDLLFLACAKLGFIFEYGGYRIRAEKSDGTAVPQAEPRQLSFSFTGKFNLTDEQPDLALAIKRPQGRIDLSISLGAAAT